MVSFKGINVSIASSKDAGRAREYNISPEIDHTYGLVTTCHVPLLSGTQMWIEYSIDGPHPPGALYLFKLLIGDHNVSSWVCARSAKFRQLLNIPGLRTSTTSG